MYMTPQVLSLMESKLYCGHETRATELNSTFKWKYLLPDVKKKRLYMFFWGGLHGCQGKVNAEAFIWHSTAMRLLTRPLSQICFPI